MMSSPNPRRRSGPLCAAALLLLAAPALQAQDMAVARSLAASCSGCHGTYGNARGDIPPLAGQPAARIVTAMADYRDGRVPATVMHQIAKGYTDAQIQQIAAWFAAQPAARP